MRRADLSARAALRRDIALELRAAGATWTEIGRHLGVSPPRAQQIAYPNGMRFAGNPSPSPPRVPGTTRVGEYVEARARAVDESARAIFAQRAADRNRGGE